MSLQPEDSCEVPDYRPCMECTGFNLRKANRAVSQLYDEMLRPVGIRGTQFSLLVVLQMHKAVSVTQLAEGTVMDRTTLTRNLEVLEKQGLVKVNPGDDRRTRIVTITEAGTATLSAAFPLWQQAQCKIKEVINHERLQAFMEDLATLIKVSQAG